ARARQDEQRERHLEETAAALGLRLRLLVGEAPRAERRGRRLPEHLPRRRRHRHGGRRRGWLRQACDRRRHRRGRRRHRHRRKVEPRSAQLGRRRAERRRGRRRQGSERPRRRARRRGRHAGQRRPARQRRPGQRQRRRRRPRDVLGRQLERLSLGLGRRQRFRRPGLLQDVGGRLVGHRAVVILEEQIGRALLDGLVLGVLVGLVEDLGVELFVVPPHLRRRRRPPGRGALGRRRRGWRRAETVTGARDGGPPRDLLRGRHRGRDLPVLLDLGVVLLDLGGEGLLHPPGQILARIELADRIEERLQIVVQIDGVAVAVLGIARQRLQHQALQLGGDLLVVGGRR